MTHETAGETFTMQGAPPLQFGAFLLGLASTTLIHLGEQVDPQSGSRSVDLTAARQSIDLLRMLRDKTRGNLSGDEDQLFASILSDLQFRFLEKSQSK